LEASKIGFILVGLWWFGWSQWTFKVLPGQSKVNVGTENKFKAGFSELQTVWSELKTIPVLGKFLRAFFMTSLGLQTLIIVAPLFAINVVKMTGVELIVVVLIMQFLGIVGAVFFSKLSKSKGNVISLMIATGVYILICVSAFFFADKTLFYIQAGFLGFALGGIQSQARSGYAKLLPEVNHTASYFSFYDVLEKVAIVLGTFIYAGITIYFSHLKTITAPRIGILVLGVFFMIGLILWLPLRKEVKLK
jgi:UMF1 family MFS transporter